MKVNIAVHGCVHGDLRKVYEIIQDEQKTAELEKTKKIDLLIILGDVQTLRNLKDLVSVSIPPRYLYNNNLDKITDFPKYDTGVLKIDIPTLVIGGNHENMKQFIDLPYGGYICPNLYYMGIKNVINFKNLTIGGFSGITNIDDIYMDKIITENIINNNNNTSELTKIKECEIKWWNKNKKKLYHVRFMDLVPLYLMKKKKKQEQEQGIDIMMSHDWPSMVTKFGNVQDLLKRKPYFRKEVNNNELGSPLYNPLLSNLQPNYWLSSHLHVKWSSKVYSTESGIETTDTTKSNTDEIDLFGDDDEEEIKEDVPKKITQFLSLDKFLPTRPGQSFEYITLDAKDTEYEKKDLNFFYDPQYIEILSRVEKNEDEFTELINESHSFDYNFQKIWKKYNLLYPPNDSEQTAIQQKRNTLEYEVVKFDKVLQNQTDLFKERYLKDV